MLDRAEYIDLLDDDGNIYSKEDVDNMPHSMWASLANAQQLDEVMQELRDRCKERGRRPPDVSKKKTSYSLILLNLEGTDLYTLDYSAGSKILEKYVPEWPTVKIADQVMGYTYREVIAAMDMFRFTAYDCFVERVWYEFKPGDPINEVRRFIGDVKASGWRSK